MKKLLIAMIAFAVIGTAQAQESKQASVLEALNIGAALRQLGDYPEIGPNGQPTGRKVSVPFRFNGGVLMTMAMNISAADTVQKNFQTTYQTLFKQFAEGAEQMPADKVKDFNAEVEKAMAAPSGFTLGRVKEADLCLEVKPTACPVANSIPPALLAALIPIIDR